MNTAARIAAKHLKSSLVSRSPNVFSHAQTAPARIPASKFQRLPLLAALVVLHPAVGVCRTAVLPEPVERKLAGCQQKLEQANLKIENTVTKKNLIQRLRRIEGQLRGLQSMLDDGRDCREIMQQLQAAHSAIESTSRVFLQDYAASCLAQMDVNGDANHESRAAIVGEMLALMGKTP